MPEFTDMKIADQMFDVIADVEFYGEEFIHSLRAAENAYDSLPMYLEYLYTQYTADSGLDEEVEATVDYPTHMMKTAIDDLKTFDKALIKLLALRLRFAQESGIPLNITRGREWTRLTEFTL